MYVSGSREGVYEHVRAIYPVHMGRHGFEALGGHFLKAHKHLDFFVENLDFPPKPIRNEDLPRLSFQIIAGKVFSPAFWPLFEF